MSGDAMTGLDALDAAMCHILDHPEEWDQTKWSTCLAAWVVRMQPGVKFINHDFVTYKLARWFIPRLAAQIVGVDVGPIFPLWCCSNTLEQLQLGVIHVINTPDFTAGSLKEAMWS